MLMSRFRVKYTCARSDGMSIVEGPSKEDVCLGYDEADVLMTLINAKNLYSFDFIQEIDENGDYIYREDENEV